MLAYDNPDFDQYLSESCKGKKPQVKRFEAFYLYSMVETTEMFVRHYKHRTALVKTL
ncbi:hypothetical protein J2W55_000672 [Mucilaginibacter pocheonensis]|uniref:Uncharacterized protein n=1 Tax=Mucilaginibacter pocheonensis TaxID=398050 RepID=A0ABU1T659_9SPHI|nr:hypothetical protein [Mucilaginibacter pocheonensis]